MLATLQYPSLISAAALGTFFLNRDPRRSLRSVDHPVLRLCGVILLLGIVSVPTSLYPGASFGFIRGDFIKTFMLMVLVTASIRSFLDVERYCLTLLVGAAMYAIFVSLNFDLGVNGRLDDLITYDSNDLGLWLVCSLPLTVYFASQGQRSWTRWGALGLLALLIATIVLTGSRGAFVGLVTVSAYVLLSFKSISRTKRFLVVAAGIIFLSTAAGDTYWKMMSTLLNPTQDYNWVGNTGGGRMQIWMRGFGYMLDRPLTGVGIGQFQVAEGTLSPDAALQELGIGLKWSAAHNSFVQIGAELGVFGLMALIALLVVSFRSVRFSGSAKKHARAALTEREAALGQALGGSLLGYVASGFFLSQAYGAYILVLYGIIAGYGKVVTPNVGTGAVASRLRPQTYRKSAKPNAPGPVGGGLSSASIRR